MRTLILKRNNTEYEEKLVNHYGGLVYSHYMESNFRGSYILQQENKEGFLFKGWILQQEVKLFINRNNLLIIEE